MDCIYVSVYLHELLALYIALNAMMFTLIGRAASGRQNERIDLIQVLTG